MFLEGLHHLHLVQWLQLSPLLPQGSSLSRREPLACATNRRLTSWATLLCNSTSLNPSHRKLGTSPIHRQLLFLSFESQRFPEVRTWRKRAPSWPALWPELWMPLVLRVRFPGSVRIQGYSVEPKLVPFDAIIIMLFCFCKESSLTFPSSRA